MTNTSSNPSRVPNLYICRIRRNIPASELWIYLPTQSSEPNFCNGCSKIAQKLINQLWLGLSTSYGIFFLQVDLVVVVVSTNLVLFKLLMSERLT